MRGTGCGLSVPRFLTWGQSGVVAVTNRGNNGIAVFTQ